MFVLTAYWNLLALPCVHFLSGLNEHKKAHNNIYFTMHAKRRFMIRQPCRTRKHQKTLQPIKGNVRKENQKHTNTPKKKKNHNVIFVSLRREAYIMQ